MKLRKHRKITTWEVALFLTPLLVLILVAIVSRLKTIEIPQQQLIQKGKPLFTVTVRYNPQARPEKSFAIYHAVRMPNGKYKIYWIEQPQVSVIK